MPKQYTTAEILTDGKGMPIPQYLDVTDKTDSPQGTFKPYVESILQEIKTQADAVSGVVTFPETIKEIEIYNMDSVEGTFVVNGISIIIPAGEVFHEKIGGTPSADVTVTGSTSYTIGRYA